MTELYNYIEEIVDEAKHHTDSVIADVSTSLLPYFVDLQYSFIRNGKYRFKNETVKDNDHIIMKVEGIRDKTLYIKNKEDGIYTMGVWDAINQNKIHPFALFINGQHVKWSDMTIVRDVRYTYLLLPKDFTMPGNTQINGYKEVKCLYIPFNVFYTETREKAPRGYFQFLRFSTDGDLVESGKIIYYINHPKVVYKELSFASGLIKAYDLEIDHNYRLSSQNFIPFKNKKLCLDDTIIVDRMNLFYMNGDKDSKYKIKCLYRIDINVPYNTINKFPNINLAKQLTQGSVTNNYIDTKILNTNFEFSSTADIEYEQNMRANFKYISAFDSNFLTDIYERENAVKTRDYTGKEIRERLNDFNILQIPLIKINHKKDTRVIIFCNGEIYPFYNEIKYDINSFSMPIDIDTLKDEDEFEIVNFVNINNYSEIIRYTQENKFKTQEPFLDEELLLYIQEPDDHDFADKIKLNERSWFNIPFDIDENGNVNLDEKYNDTDILYTTKNQFRYAYRKMQKDNIKIKLHEEFKAALNPNQYLVFLNGRLLNREFYRIIIPGRDNVFTDPYIYSRVKFRKGDRVEVFYTPVELKDMNYAGNLITKVANTFASGDAQVLFPIPYPFKLYTYRNDFLLFKDSVYVDPERYTAKNGYVMFTDGTYLRRGDKLTFVFVYDKCKEQEASIYINNNNSIYMERIYLPITSDGQTIFDLDNDDAIDYLMAGNGAMVLYHGMYIPQEYWDLNRYTGILTFAPNEFKKDDFITVMIVHTANFVTENIKNATISEANRHTLLDGENTKNEKLFTEVSNGFPFTYNMNVPEGDLLQYGVSLVTDRCIKAVRSVIDNRVSAMNSVDYSKVSTIGVEKIETRLIATYDGQTDFSYHDIPDIPDIVTTSGGFTNLENEPIYLMKNNVLLTEGDQYNIIRESNTIRFTSPLKKGEVVYMVSYSTPGLVIKSYEHDILIEDVNQLEYDLYEIFGKLDNAKYRFIIYIGSLVLDHRRYEMDKNCKLTFVDNTMFEKGQHIRIIAMYMDEEDRSMYTFNYLGSSRYHSITQTNVNLIPGEFTYTIPYPDRDFKSGFIIMLGGIIIDESRYYFDSYNDTITFLHQDDNMFRENDNFRFIFIHDDMRAITVNNVTGRQIDDRRYTYDIPVPFKNYFLAGNSILVFNGSLLMDPERYTINPEDNTITLNEDERIENTTLRYIFIYHTNNHNHTFDNEELGIATIQKSGYIFMNKDVLDHPFSKSLFWLFINGKKITLNDITNISSNIVKVNKDQRTRYNMVLLSHTPKVEELDYFFKTYSNFDTLINNMNIEDVNELFNSYRVLSDTEPHYDMDVTKEALVTEIVRDWYIRTGYYKGSKFINTYSDITGVSDIQFDTETNEIHSMVLDASKYFSARLDRSNTNPDTPQR